MLMVDKNNWFMKMLYIRVDTQNSDASSVLTWDLNKNYWFEYTSSLQFNIINNSSLNIWNNKLVMTKMSTIKIQQIKLN